MREYISNCNMSLFLTCLISLAHLFEASAEQAPTQELANFLVDKSELSNQIDWPFRLQDKIVDSTHPLWSRYEHALSAFPSTESCLMESANAESRFDLIKVDWGRFQSHQDIEVCLFRIADSLGGPSEMVSWLKESEYEVSGPIQQIKEGQGSSSNEGWYAVSATLDHITFEKRVEFTPTFLGRLFRQFFSESSSQHDDHALILNYSKTGRITAVQSLIRGG